MVIRFIIITLFENQGFILSNVRNHISEQGKIATKELGGCVRTSEGLRGWLLDKNDISVGAKQGLTDYELIATLRISNILNTCLFKKEIRLGAKTMEFAQKMAIGVPDLKFRDDFQLIGAQQIDSYDAN